MKRISFLTLLSVLYLVPVSGQTLYSGGATVQVTAGGLLWVNGGAEWAGASAIGNEGEITVSKNSTFPAPGNFIIRGSSVVGGNGRYRVEQDWINDATFAGGTVELYGNTVQYIGSGNNTVTSFHHLELTGTGTGNDRKKVLLNVDAGTDATGTLRINDRELATESRRFFVLNPAAAAVSNDLTFGAEGFVSSLVDGFFSRATAANTEYAFPLGSSAFGNLRYRPLHLVPADAAPNVYAARLNNFDADLDGHSRSALAADLCTLNGLYYHSLQRVAGTSAADVRFSYLSASDGNWTRTVRWQTAGAAWNSMGAAVAGSAGGFSTLTKTAWNFPDADHPYILATPRPLPPVIQCPSICENSLDNVFTATGSSTGYVWTVPQGTTLMSGQGTGTVSVAWGTGSGYVFVSAVGTAGCDSRPDSCLPLVKVSPTAAFDIWSADEFSLGYTFTGKGLYGDQWTWDFGDGHGASQQSPTHLYEQPGTYEVSLTVTTKEGCADSANGLIVIENNEVYIPNTFTPNDDGLNEGFRPVNRSGKSVSFFIFNRWGECIYAASDITAAWNGTYAGKPCPQDIYVCKVEWTDARGAQRKFTGHVTLIR